ncbi:MAG: DUF2235 domain-containing protein [Pseudomonadales bacterium]|nr:DUF2235 domain-containing protein [Pseudomonadales bacterium]MBO6566222.1 DUF2235 domain-containing protein [Pseudomonadales bacterium]MBO6595463.1 DUF2235 domain-containing protein [Pseudomonadales bacterium]MBO6701963.1 DUF2235 domain-containing protein [Pseudomonadales bacterium]MBO6820978.1 DUF2235 domain-containing protein [Pseudomonadales bacterium]
MANIVVCADGTWNRPEEDIEKDHPTNVLKLARGVAPSGANSKQHVFYDWGLGSYHSGLSAGSTGRGIHKNILDGYRYIVQNYANGDDIYLFGFSRGAYTVRALCGLINNCGIIKRHDARLIQQAWDIYKSPSKKNRPDGSAASDFRSNHCHQLRNVHFVGVWDTVGALGIPISLMGMFDGNDEFYDNRMGSNVSIARHALAIDERREDFAPTIWQPKPGVDLKQIWFAGSHADVGGSYEPDDDGKAIADVPLQWMLDEASSAGLEVEHHLKTSLTDGTLAQMHESRRKLYRFRGKLDRDLVYPETPIRFHPSVKQRYESNPEYRPPKLKKLVDDTGWQGLDVGT